MIIVGSHAHNNNNHDHINNNFPANNNIMLEQEALKINRKLRPSPAHITQKSYMLP